MTKEQIRLLGVLDDQIMDALRSMDAVIRTLRLLGPGGPPKGFSMSQWSFIGEANMDIALIARLMVGKLGFPDRKELQLGEQTNELRRK